MVGIQIPRQCGSKAGKDGKPVPGAMENKSPLQVCVLKSSSAAVKRINWNRQGKSGN